MSSDPNFQSERAERRLEEQLSDYFDVLAAAMFQLPGQGVLEAAQGRAR